MTEHRGGKVLEWCGNLVHLEHFAPSSAYQSSTLPHYPRNASHAPLFLTTTIEAVTLLPIANMASILSAGEAGKCPDIACISYVFLKVC